MNCRTSWLAATCLLGALLSGSTGCASAPEAGERLGQKDEAIINGVASTQADDAAVGLVLLSPAGDFMGACSGVLIAPNLVLTARHCVSKTDEGASCKIDGTPVNAGKIYTDYKPEQLAILTGPKIKFDFSLRAKKVFTNGSKNLCNADIALVLFERDVTDAPFAKIRLNAPPVKAETLLAVGWGVSNNSSGYGRRRRDKIPVDIVGPNRGLRPGEIIAPNEFAIGEGICSGDSGGPAFANSTGAVIGVVSRGGNGLPRVEGAPDYAGCVDTADGKAFNIYTRVDTFKELILTAFAEAGKEPWFEDGPDPRKAKFGEACDGPDACRSALCIDVGGSAICSDKCDPAASTCPSGSYCVPDLAVCAPGSAPPPNTGTTTNESSSCAIAAGSSGTDAGLSGKVVALGLVGLALVGQLTRARRRTW